MTQFDINDEAFHLNINVKKMSTQRLNVQRPGRDLSHLPAENSVVEVTLRRVKV